jgi:hypothetical protein
MNTQGEIESAISACMDRQRSQIVTFYLTCPEPRAWLVIHSDIDGPRVVEMWNGYPNHWSASAWLFPGKYHCRFYCGDDHNVIYHGPARMTGCCEETMEGLVSVEQPKDTNDFAFN